MKKDSLQIEKTDVSSGIYFLPSSDALNWNLDYKLYLQLLGWTYP